MLGDVLGDVTRSTKQKSMEIIGKEGGVLVLIREGRATSISESLRGRTEKRRKKKSSQPASLKTYGVGAQILRDLGVKKMVLMTNHPDLPVTGLEGYGLEIAGYRSLR